MTIVKVVSYKVTDKFLNHQSLINFHILVKTGDKWVHLVIYRRVVCDFCLYYSHLLWLAFLCAKLWCYLAVLFNLIL
jgi:hypothetical protein